MHTDTFPRVFAFLQDRNTLYVRFPYRVQCADPYKKMDNIETIFFYRQLGNDSHFFRTIYG